MGHVERMNMKKTVAFIAVIALLSCWCAPHFHYPDYDRRGPIVISEQVGVTIDASERDKFDLFQGVDGFKEAQLYSVLAGGYEVEIITENQKLIGVNGGPQAVVILRDYIDRYNEIEVSKVEFEEKWKIADYDDLGQPITMDEVKRRRRGTSACLAGGASGFFAGSIAGFAIGSIDVRHDVDVWDFSPIIGCLIGGSSGCLMGAGLGYLIDGNKAMKVIKEARKLTVVD